MYNGSQSPIVLGYLHIQGCSLSSMECKSGGERKLALQDGFFPQILWQVHFNSPVYF